MNIGNGVSPDIFFSLNTFIYLTSTSIFPVISEHILKVLSPK